MPFLQPLVGKHLLTPTALYLDELTRGSALESMSLYTWRTPDYQLSGAQNFKMGFYGAQQHMWRGTLDQDTWVFTTAPGGSEDDYAAGAWTGGWLPQGLFHENVAILRYQRDDYPLAENTYFVDYTHAFFPKTRMDEVIESGHWVFGRKGDSFVGLYSNNATHWSTIEETQTYELIADGKNNVWILELGSTSEQGSFQSFVAALENSDIVVSSDQIDYQSPSQGLMTASLDGTLKSAGQSIDVGPYKRWDNAYSTQDFGSLSTVIEYNNKRLTLDFETSQRSYQEGPAQ